VQTPGGQAGLGELPELRDHDSGAEEEEEEEEGRVHSEWLAGLGMVSPFLA
jgi:hypothetical protein